MVGSVLSRPVAYYAYLSNIFNSFLRLQNLSLFQQKHGFFRSSIMAASVEQEQCWDFISQLIPARFQCRFLVWSRDKSGQKISFSSGKYKNAGQQRRRN
jgi:hypothetical protein